MYSTVKCWAYYIFALTVVQLKYRKDISFLYQWHDSARHHERCIQLLLSVWQFVNFKQFETYVYVEPKFPQVNNLNSCGKMFFVWSDGNVGLS